MQPREGGGQHADLLEREQVAKTTSAPTTADWVAFAKTMDGAVYLPGTSQYSSALQLFDPSFDSNSPTAVAQVASEADVARCVQFAGQHGLHVSPRSGGHSYVGASAANGTFVVDGRKLSKVSYSSSSQTATVSCGANLYSVHSTLAGYGRTIPTGTCPTVGAAGLTLGGGLGVESREVGLTCDRLVGARVVLADGSVADATSSTNSDLFWALRGGGGGNICYVLWLRYATHTAGSKGIFQLSFPATNATDVVTRWASWMAGAKSSWWSNMHISTSGSSVSLSVVGVVPAGEEREAGESLTSAVGTAPSSATYLSKSYMDAVRFLGGGTTSARVAFTGGTDILGRADSGSVAAVIGNVASYARSGGSGVAILDPLGGVVSTPGASDTAFPWRDHAMSVQWYVTGRSSGATGFVKNGHKALAGRSSGGYINYLESGDSASRYYGGNLARLTEIRQQRDPNRLFSSGVSF